MNNETNDKEKEKEKEIEKEKEKLTILGKDEIKVEFSYCHNCKMKKPIELMIQCKNKSYFRPIKSSQIFNMSLLRSIFL